MEKGKHRYGRLIVWGFIGILALSFTSCISGSKMKYIHQGDDFNIKNSYFNERKDRPIRPFDNLYLKIMSIEGQEVVTMLDMDAGMQYGTQINLTYYNVSDSGSINIPFIKDIHIAGLTLKQAKNKIEKELSGYLINPSIIIKYVNQQITILGEVNAPGTYPYAKETINIFQALGLAGGLTQYGNKEEVLLVREENGLITRNVIDLTDKKLLESYYYYLQPDDVIIIDHVKAKYYGKGAITYTSLLTTLSTVITILYFFNLN